MAGMAGKSALVTGAGRGLGRAISMALARSRARVIAVARTESDLRSLVAEIEAAGGEAHHFVCDVADRDAVTATMAAVGPVDILINNAGIAPGAPVLQTDEELWERTLQLNMTSPFRLIRLVLPGMMERRWGRIINIGSMLSKTAFPNTVAYTSSKHGLLGLTRAVATEVVRYGITVNAICPAYLDTPMTAATAAEVAKKYGKSPDEVLAGFTRSNPQKRLIQPEEVAHVALMLCGEEARGITGQGINVDGGAVL